MLLQRVALRGKQTLAQYNLTQRSKGSLDLGRLPRAVCLILPPPDKSIPKPIMCQGAIQYQAGCWDRDRLQRDTGPQEAYILVALKGSRRVG